MFFALGRLVVFGFLALSIVYVCLSLYSRSVRRGKLEAEWDEEIKEGDREAFVQDGLDVAFRVGHLEDSSLIGRYLGDVKAIMCASPDYIARKGKPSHPSQLSEHQIIAITGREQWPMKGPDSQEININIKPRLKVNDLSNLYNLALSGAGIAALPILIAATSIKNKELIPVLCEWPFEAHPIHALYASNRHLSAKVRSFVDFVIEKVRPNPPWLVDMDGHDTCDEAV